MIGIQNTVCIIPARGGSKRLPRKNILSLNGKPLLAYTVEAVVKSGCFSDVFVSSDDESILEIGERYGALADKRPHHLSGDKTKAIDVVVEFIKRQNHEDRWKNVAMCLPTCPFRTIKDVQQAMELFDRRNEDCPRLIGVTRCDFPPQLALKKLENKNQVDMREPDAYGYSTRTQDIEELFFPNGSIYISTVDEYLISESFFGRPMLAYEMPIERSFDIDYEYQFKIAEFMMQQMNNQI